MQLLEIQIICPLLFTSKQSWTILDSESNTELKWNSNFALQPNEVSIFVSDMYLETI